MDMTVDYPVKLWILYRKQGENGDKYCCGYRQRYLSLFFNSIRKDPPGDCVQEDLFVFR